MDEIRITLMLDNDGNVTGTIDGSAWAFENVLSALPTDSYIRKFIKEVFERGRPPRE